MSDAPEVRTNKDGSLDEIVAHGAFFHLEQMGPRSWWLCVEVAGKKVDVWLESHRRITAQFETNSR